MNENEAQQAPILGQSLSTVGLGAAAKKWAIEVSQNGWEYTGRVTVVAVRVEKTGEKSVIADGVEIEFDEEIRIIESRP